MGIELESEIYRLKQVISVYAMEHQRAFTRLVYCIFIPEISVADGDFGIIPEYHLSTIVFPDLRMRVQKYSLNKTLPLIGHGSTGQRQVEITFVRVVVREEEDL